MNSIYEKYAKLLTEYCLQVKKNDQVYIRSTYLSEPLLQELLKEIATAGGLPVMVLDIAEQNRILMDAYKEHQLKWIDPVRKLAMESFDCFVNIMAPFNLRETQNIDPKKSKIAKEASKPVRKIYSQRTATLEMRRTLCLFPTQASAQEAGMSLKEYENFVFQSCYLFEKDPIAAWKKVRKYQQTIVDYLNDKKTVKYIGANIDIAFSTKGRTWMNSDGKTNMPSGEVYTAPVENSVNGMVRFSFPSIYQGQEVEDIQLEVKDGEVVKWNAKRGQNILDNLFTIPGATRFGEAAVGTNMNIQRMTKNILFDEKIGGTIHMALGQSYLQCGGKNESAVHWDLITDMKEGGEIYADDELIYQNGKFLIA